MANDNIVEQINEAIRTENLVLFVKENLGELGNLSIRGVAGLCGVRDTSIIRGAAFKSDKLAEKMAAQGFEAAALICHGFPPLAVWAVVEYFAYESKAEAPTAQLIAKTFGAFGVKTAFEKVAPAPAQPRVIPRSIIGYDRTDIAQLSAKATALLSAGFQVITTRIDYPDGSYSTDVVAANTSDQLTQVARDPAAPLPLVTAPVAFDSVQDFLFNSGIINTDAGRDSFVTCAELLRQYDYYCAEHAPQPIEEADRARNSTALGRRASKLLGKSSVRKKCAKKVVRGYTGIAVG